MFDELKTYGIISVLLILVLGYFVYIIYRDNIILKNNVKELKESLFNDEEDSKSQSEEDEDEEHYHDEESGVVYTDLDEYFSHVTPNNLHTIEEVEELPELEILEEPKQKKTRTKKNKKEEVVELDNNSENVTIDE